MTQPDRPSGISSSGISVVIPTFRRAHLLSEVVQPLLSDPSVVEIVIVDDGSDDSTPAVCAELARSDARVSPIRQENAGEAAARATGAAAASNDLVLFFDDDVVATPSTASGHLAHHQQASGPLVVLGYMPPRRPSPRRPGDFPTFVYELDYEQACRRYESDPSYVLKCLWGGNFSVRREIFLAANAVPGVLPYHQDQVLGWSLRHLGCTGVFDRELAAEHHYSRSPAQFFHDCRRHGHALAMMKAISPPSDIELDPRAGLASPVRAAVRTLTNGPQVGTRILRALLLSAGRVHWWKMETMVARLLRQIESYRAFIATPDEPGEQSTAQQ